MIAPVAELEKCLAKLPGFGRRSASRAALALVREPARLAEPLVAALRAAHDSVRCCSRCGAFTTIDRDPCDMCTDATRDGFGTSITLHLRDGQDDYLNEWRIRDLVKSYSDFIAYPI